MEKTKIDRFQLIQLFDYYQMLLTDKQQKYFIYAYHQDWSLGEIAQIFNVSRTAVHDALNTICKELLHYESILKLQAKGLKRKKIIAKIKDKDLQDELLKLE